MTYPESHYFEVTLERDHLGLGITVAGYVCEQEELSGIFIKSIENRINLIGKIQVNDRIVKVNGKSVVGLRNSEAINAVKNGGFVVVLGLERYVPNQYQLFYEAELITSRPLIPNVIIDDLTMKIDSNSRKSSTCTLVDDKTEFLLGAKSDTSSLSMVSALVTLTVGSERDEYETCVEESLSDDVDLSSFQIQSHRQDSIDIDYPPQYSSEPLLNQDKSYDAYTSSDDDELFNYASKEDVGRFASAPCIQKRGSKDQSAENLKEVTRRKSVPCTTTSDRMWRKRMKWTSHDHLYGSRSETMTVAKKCFSASSEEELNMLENRWGTNKTIIIHKPSGISLGLSIVGGSVDLKSPKKFAQTVRGVFVKSVVADSPAGRSGQFKVGDKILEVNNIDLRKSTHEEAVNTIRGTTTPFTFLIQPLKSFDNVEKQLETHQHPSSTNIYDINYNNLDTKSIPVTEPDRSEIKPEETNKPTTYESDSDEDDDDEEDVRDYEGKITTAQGYQIDRASAGNVKRTKAEIEADKEEEDEYAYTANKIRKKYAHLQHTVAMVQLERSQQGLGLSLAGHKDRNCMAVFVCGLNPNGIAYRTGGIQVGDEILEVNGIVLHGRCHLNASAIIKGLSGPTVKVILLRRKTAIEDIAVRPITQFPVSFEDEVSEDKFQNYPNVRSVTLQKGTQSLGIMIIEGKHAEVGQGIFISDIQEGSAAEKAGLEIGEMILAVNKDSLLGANYDNAATLLKRTEGFVTLIVSNPGKKNLPDDSASPKNSTLPSRATTPIPEPPADPTTCAITPGRETAIEIAADNKGLGINFIGGRDTHIQSRIIILEVYSGGAAAKDGRLNHGDQILEANGVCLKDVSHETALQTLRQTLPKMKLIIFRPATVEYTVVDVELTKKPGKALGICLIGRKDKMGVYVSEMLNGSVADSDGRIMKGDIVTTVNGQNVEKMNSEDIGALLKTASGRISLKLHRFKLSN